MEEGELLRRLLAQQERILSRLDALERSTGERRPAEPTVRPPEGPGLSPDLKERLVACIDTPRYLPKVELARSLLADLYDIERALTGDEDANLRNEVMRVHTGLLNMLSSLGVNTSDLPLELSTQDAVLSRVDRDLDTYERQARSCAERSRAEGIIDDLRGVADTLTVNRKRFHAVEEVDRRLGRVIRLMSELSGAHGIKLVYMPPRARPARPVPPRRARKRAYIEAPNAVVMDARVERIEAAARALDPAARPVVLALLDEAEEDLPSVVEGDARERLRQRLAAVRSRVERIEGEDPLLSLERAVESLGERDPGKERRPRGQ